MKKLSYLFFLSLFVLALSACAEEASNDQSMVETESQKINIEVDEEAMREKKLKEYDESGIELTEEAKEKSVKEEIEEEKIKQEEMAAAGFSDYIGKEAELVVALNKQLDALRKNCNAQEIQAWRDLITSDEVVANAYNDPKYYDQMEELYIALDKLLAKCK